MSDRESRHSYEFLLIVSNQWQTAVMDFCTERITYYLPDEKKKVQLTKHI